MKALVTGGGGFLGSAIVRLLRARGDQVRSLSRQRYASLDALRVEQIPGDISDLPRMEKSCHGCDIVFHVAAKAGVGGRYRDYYQTNVVGTENVIAACRRNRISRLVYTSSPSVVFNGRDMENLDESVPYPRHYDAAYPETKAKAERLVLAANDAQLATVALRPHLIWGPGDNHLVPRILARGQSRCLRRIGPGNKKIDSVYIDNAAEAHLLAADRLQPHSAIAGRAYFISNGEPMPTWDLINAILAAGGVQPVTKSVPVWLAVATGWLLEKTYAVLWPNVEPPMTPFVARELATAHWFNLTAARNDLGYVPKVSITEGLKRLAQSLQIPPGPQ